LADVASVIEGDVIKVWNSYDAALGPRTNVELSNVVTHIGNPLPRTTFSQLGGPLPDGTEIMVQELPAFTMGARYILFFGQNGTVYGPIWARLAFRVERPNGKPVVLGPEGHPVLHFGVEGVHFGQNSWLEPAPDRSKHVAGNAFREASAVADSELASALGPDDFIAAARQALASVGTSVGAAIVLDPPSGARWDTVDTTP